MKHIHRVSIRGATGVSRHSEEMSEARHAIGSAAATWGFSLACFGSAVIFLDMLYSTVYRRPFSWSLCAPTAAIERLNGMHWRQGNARFTSGFQLELGYTLPRINAALCLVCMFVAYTPGALGMPAVQLFSNTAGDFNVWFSFVPCIWLILSRTFDFTRSLAETRVPLGMLFTAPIAAVVISFLQSDDTPATLVVISFLTSILFSFVIFAMLASQLSEYILTSVLEEAQGGFSPETSEETVGAAFSLLASSAGRDNGSCYLARLPAAYFLTTSLPILLLMASRQDDWTPTGDVFVAIVLFAVGPVLQYGFDFYFRPAAFQTERRLFRFFRTVCGQPGLDEIIDRVRVPSIQTQSYAVSGDDPFQSPSRPTTQACVAATLAHAQRYNATQAEIERNWGWFLRSTENTQ